MELKGISDIEGQAATAAASERGEERVLNSCSSVEKLTQFSALEDLEVAKVCKR